jgi:hypothetical protein
VGHPRLNGLTLAERKRYVKEVIESLTTLSGHKPYPVEAPENEELCVRVEACPYYKKHCFEIATYADWEQVSCHKCSLYIYAVSLVIADFEEIFKRIYKDVVKAASDIELIEKADKKVKEHKAIYDITYIRIIQNLVSKAFDVNISDFFSNSRVRRVFKPRQIAMYLCRRLTDVSYPEIGRLFGNKHHTTIMYAYDNISDLINSDETLNNIVNDLIKEIAAFGENND